MENKGLTDWKGKPADKAKHGGAKAAYFVHFMVVANSIAYVPNMMNMVTYLHEKMHEDIASSSTIVTNFIGATCAFALLGAFLSDSYISRFYCILIFGPIQFLGYALLALQAHLLSLQPPKCNIMNNCEIVANAKAAFLYLSLYTIALGRGCLNSCEASFGGDQFDELDVNESQQKSSFFNWYTFDISLGSFIGLIFIVWIENDKGWDYGFSISAITVLLGVASFASGYSFYRNQIPKGSPLTRILQVLVAAFKNRKLNLPETSNELHQIDVKEEIFRIEVLPHTEGLEFLDKAATVEGNRRGAWRLCTVSQVEEAKIVFRMLPIFLSSLLCCLCVPLLLTLTVQQGNIMSNRLGKIHFPPASLMVIPVTFQLLFLVLYDSAFVPFARKLTGYRSGITPLQRAGCGFISIVIAMCVAGMVERKRRAAESQMSVFWLGGQFFFIGFSDVTSFVGLLEFFVEEASAGMKSMGTAFFYCVFGVASLLASFVIQAVNKATRYGGQRRGWLDGRDLNQSRLDCFYWLLSAMAFLGFVNYLYWANKYAYRRDPKHVNSASSNNFCH